MWQEEIAKKDLLVLCGARSRYIELHRNFVLRQGFCFVNQEFLTNGYFFTCIFVGLKLSLAVFPPLKTALIASNFLNPCQITILYMLTTLFKRIKPRFQCVHVIARTQHI